MLYVCSIFDKAVGAYMQPFFTRSKGEAVRSLTQALGDPKSPFAAVPTDYTLFVLGTWDDSKGELKGLPSPEKVIGAWEVLSPKD